jgi:hypothetical protein
MLSTVMPKKRTPHPLTQHHFYIGSTKFISLHVIAVSCIVLLLLAGLGSVSYLSAQRSDLRQQASVVYTCQEKLGAYYTGSVASCTRNQNLTWDDIGCQCISKTAICAKEGDVSVTGQKCCDGLIKDSSSGKCRRSDQPICYLSPFCSGNVGMSKPDCIESKGFFSKDECTKSVTCIKDGFVATTTQKCCDGLIKDLTSGKCHQSDQPICYLTPYCSGNSGMNKAECIRSKGFFSKDECTKSVTCIKDGSVMTAGQQCCEGLIKDLTSGKCHQLDQPICYLTPYCSGNSGMTKAECIRSKGFFFKDQCTSAMTCIKDGSVATATQKCCDGLIKDSASGKCRQSDQPICYLTPYCSGNSGMNKEECIRSKGFFTKKECQTAPKQ